MNIYEKIETCLQAEETAKCALKDAELLCSGWLVCAAEGDDDLIPSAIEAKPYIDAIEARLIEAKAASMAVKTLAMTQEAQATNPTLIAFLANADIDRDYAFTDRLIARLCKLFAHR